jgi:integrase
MLEKNPVTRIPLFKEDNKVEHYLNQEELGRLLSVLNTYQNRNVCHIAMWLLSTGARLNEALQARWDQLDREKRLWRIPASNSKSRRVRSVPLNDFALDILNELETEGEYEHLFVNRATGKPFVEIHRVWVRIKTAARLPHIRLHDLRHQYASMLVNSGRTLYEVQQILGHSNPIVTQRYAHLSTKTLQDAANSASDMIKGASGSA